MTLRRAPDIIQMSAKFEPCQVVVRFDSERLWGATRSMRIAQMARNTVPRKARLVGSDINAVEADYALIHCAHAYKLFGKRDREIDTAGTAWTARR